MTRHLLLFAILFTCSLANADNTRPNVVLFLVDDMGWMDSGAYGSQFYETPNIDRFARRSMRFTNAYSQPLCSPTRASILSGQYSARHGITSATGHQAPQPTDHVFLAPSPFSNLPMLVPESKNYLEPAQVTLAETLKATGYRTAHIGKWHLGLTPPHWPEKQGFDVAFHCHPDPGPPGNYFSPYQVKPEGVPSPKNRVGTITDGPEGEYIVDRQAAEAVSFIQASRNTPFFLNLWCYGVHGPWGHKEEYTRRFAEKKDPTGRQGNPIMASMLRSVDECFGQVLAALDEHALTNNTIVIFYSDNGGNTHSNTTAEGAKSANADWQRWAAVQPPTNNSPLRDGKGTLYEGGTRVPLMWSWPNHIKPGSLNDSIVGPIDIYPTLVDLIGLAKPAEQRFDGVSYSRTLRGEGTLNRRAYFNYHPHAGKNRAGGVWVRSGDFKLIRWFGIPNTHELYNLREDLSESKDLSEIIPEKVAELGLLIDGFLQDTGALYPRPNPNYSASLKAKSNPPLKGTSSDTNDVLQGWKERGCKATVADGILTMKGLGASASPFLGHATGRLQGPATMKLRLRSAMGGAGRIDRVLNPSADNPEILSTPFQVTSGDWQDIQIELKEPGPLGTIRLYLPVNLNAIEIDSIELVTAQGVKESWKF